MSKKYLEPHTIVKIKEDLKPGLYESHCITNKMLDFRGKVTTITEVVKVDNSKDEFLYSISVDGGKYWWKRDNFEDKIYSPAIFIASELGLTYDELISDFVNSTGKNPDEEIDESELDKYVKIKYNKFLY